MRTGSGELFNGFDDGGESGAADGGASAMARFRCCDGEGFHFHTGAAICTQINVWRARACVP